MDTISPLLSSLVASAADKVIKRFHQELITSINQAIHEAVEELRGDTNRHRSNVKDRALTIGLDPLCDADTCAALGCLASNNKQKQQTCSLQSSRSSIVHDRHNKYTCNRSAAISKSLIEHYTEDAELDKTGIEIDDKIALQCELFDPVGKTTAHGLESSACIDISDGTVEEPAENGLVVPWTDLNDIPLDAMYAGLEFFAISEGISADTALQQVRSPETSHPHALLLEEEQCIPKECEQCGLLDLPPARVDDDQKVKSTPRHGDTAVLGVDCEVPSDEQQRLSTTSPVCTAAETQARESEASRPGLLILDRQHSIAEERQQHRSLGLPAHGVDEVQGVNDTAQDDTAVLGTDHTVPSEEQRYLSAASSVNTAVESPPRTPEASLRDMVILDWQQNIPEEAEQCKSLGLAAAHYHGTPVLGMNHQVPSSKHEHLSTTPSVDTTAEVQVRPREALHADGVILDKEQTLCEEHEEYESLGLPTDDKEHDEEVKGAACYDDTLAKGNDHEVPSNKHQQLSTKSSVDTAAEMQARSPEASHLDVVICGKEETICEEHEDYKSVALQTIDTKYDEEVNCVARYDDTVVLGREYEVPFNKRQQLSTKSSVDTAAEMKARSPEASHLHVVISGKEETICEEHEDYKSLALPTNDTKYNEEENCVARYDDTAVLGRDYEVPSNEHQQQSAKSSVETAAKMQARSPGASHPDVVIFGTEQTICEEHEDYKSLVLPTNETEYGNTMVLGKDHEEPFNERQQLSNTSLGDSAAERQARSSAASHPDVVIFNQRQRTPKEREQCQPPGPLTDDVEQDEVMKSEELHDDTAVLRMDIAVSSGAQQHRLTASSADVATETQLRSPEDSHADVVILKKERSIPEEQVQRKSLGLPTDGMEDDEEVKGAAHFDDTVVWGMDHKVLRNQHEHLSTTSSADPISAMQEQSIPEERKEYKSVGLLADGNDDKDDNEKEQAMPKECKQCKPIGLSADGTNDNNAVQSIPEEREHRKSVCLAADGTDDNGEEHSIPEEHEHCKSFGLSAGENDDNHDNDGNDGVLRTTEAGFRRPAMLLRKWHQLRGRFSQSIPEEREQCKSVGLSAGGIDDKHDSRERPSIPEERERCKSFGLPVDDNDDNDDNDDRDDRDGKHDKDDKDDKDDTDDNDWALGNAKASFHRPAMVLRKWHQMRVRFSSRSFGCEKDILDGDVGLTKIVAIIVPYRPQKSCPNVREGQLGALKAYFGRFLQHCKAQCILVVAQQTEDGNKFNRGQLLNVGYRMAQDFCHMVFHRRGRKAELDSVILHDCDLLPPLSMISWYQKVPERGKPVNLSAPNLFPAATRLKYHDDVGSNWPSFFGGVVALHPADFEACNGFANDYWGWGLEDVDLWQRLKESKTVSIECPVRPMPEHHGCYIDLDENNMWDQIQRSPQHAFQNLVNDRVTQNSPPSGLGWNGENGLKGLSWRTVVERLGIMRSRTDIDALSSCTLCSGTGFPLPVLTVVVELSTPRCEGEAAVVVGTAKKDENQKPKMEKSPSLQDKLAPRDPRVALDANLMHVLDYDKDFKGTIWIVIGGFETNGIIVRRSVNLNTPVLSTRLGHGARIKEIQRFGPRVEYFKVGGQGPDRGWVSMVYKGEPLLMTEDGFSALEILAMTQG